MNGTLDAREKHYMHALQCLCDPRPPTGRTRTGRDPPRTSTGRTTIRGRMGAASTDTQRFHSAFSNRPNEAARPAARSARVPHMLPHAPHMLPIHARASAPSPRRFRCQTVPVNVQTSVRREQTQARKGWKRHYICGLGAAAHLLSRPWGAQKAPRQGQTQPGRHRSTDRSMAASQQHNPEQPTHETAL